MEQVLDLYTDYLLSSSGKTTATGLSQLLDGDLSHDKISRLLSGNDFTSKDLRKLKFAHKLNHFSLKAKIYPAASKAARNELYKIKYAAGA